MAIPYLKNKYLKEMVPQLQKQLGYSSVMQVPKLICIAINQGVGEAKTNPKSLTIALEGLTFITGQHAVSTKAKKSLSNFKLKQGTPIAARVTLRNEKMYHFLHRAYCNRAAAD